MKAVVLREHGTGGLRYETGFSDPAPGAGDVVVRVRAASLNYHDVFTHRGMPGIRIPMPAIMGLDVAAEIAAAGSAEKAARLRALGADHTIDYVREDFVRAIYALYGKPARRGADSDRGVDVVVNYTGGDTWTRSLRVLRVGGRLLTCGATAGYDPPEDIRFIWTFELQILGSNGWAREDITALLDMVQSGPLQAVIDDTFPLEEAPQALA